jgi:hypothetical protein
MENSKKRPYFIKKAIITFYDGTKQELGMSSEICDKPVKIMQEKVLDELIESVINPEYQRTNPAIRCRLIVSYI